MDPCLHRCISLRSAIAPTAGMSKFHRHRELPLPVDLLTFATEAGQLPSPE